LSERIVPTEVVVIGGGVIGASIAYHLARRGVRITLLERREIAAGASGASAGGVRQQGRDPRELPLAMAANARWRDLEAELEADLEYYRNGHVQVVEDSADLPLLAASIGEQRAAGLAIDLIDGDELRRLAPGLAPAVIAGAYTAGDGHANPGQTARAFAAAASRHGAHVQTHTSVTGLALSGGRVSGVRTDRRDIAADWVVLTAGAWSGGLLRGLGVVVPIQPAGLQMILTTARPPTLSQVITAQRRPLSLKQVRGGGYLIGGGWPGDVDLSRSRGTVRPESIAGSRAAAGAIFPAVTATEIAASWVGIEAVTPDEVPILGPVPGIANLTLAAGFSGHGFALSPSIGQAIAELIIDGEPSVPIDAFAAARFAGGEGAARVPAPTAG
jgi:sarcosine oxidase subunit beta